MMLSRKQVRGGVTLVEVLVAIFVMAVGLLTLLALFPLGVLTMQQAIQDDRAATAAGNATAIAIAHDLRHDVALDNGTTSYFLNPDPTNAKSSFANAPGDGPSYPIYVDAMGYYSYLGPWNQWVGGQQSAGVPRLAPQFVANMAAIQGQQQAVAALQWFSLLDDIQFEGDLVSYTVGASTLEWQGKPRQVATPPPFTFQRDTITSWAYLLRRPLQADPGVVEMSVVVYNKRAMALTTDPSNPQAPFQQGDEAAYTATFNTANNIVSLTWAGPNGPNIRVGGWILDATPTPNPPGGGQYTGLHAYFYRVVGATDTGPTAMDVEVQTPLRGWPANAQSSGVVVVMDQVAEVFEKGTGWRR